VIEISASGRTSNGSRSLHLRDRRQPPPGVAAPLAASAVLGNLFDLRSLRTGLQALTRACPETCHAPNYVERGRHVRLRTIDGMKRDAAGILKEALALPIEARAALAGSLLESLGTEVDEDAEAAWATEVSRRVAELDSGSVKTVPWAEVRRRLAER
jgi:putative addiction module component (TIGR02574 family)